MNLTQTNSFRLSSTFPSCQLADHKGIEIKYLCCSEECMLPLCPECIQHHSEYHERKNKVAILKNFSEVFATNQQRITKQISEIESDLQTFENFLKLNPTHETKVFSNLQEFKKQLFKSLNEFFTELEHDFSLRMTEDYNDKSEKVSRISREIKIYLEQLKKYEADLVSENYMKVMARVYRCNLSKEYNEIRSKLTKADLTLDSYELDVDESLIERINDDLYKHIALTKYDETRPSTGIVKPMLAESRVIYTSRRSSQMTPGVKFQNHVRPFEILESATVVKSEEVLGKSEQNEAEDPEQKIIEQYSEVLQSSNYIEYNYSPKFAIKDFFSGDSTKDTSPITVIHENSQPEELKNLKNDIEDTKSQKSALSDEYKSDFEGTNDEELEVIEETI